MSNYIMDQEEMEYDERLNRGVEDWFNFAGKPANESDGFYEICDKWDIEPGDLWDGVEETKLQD